MESSVKSVVMYSRSPRVAELTHEISTGARIVAITRPCFSAGVISRRERPAHSGCVSRSVPKSTARPEARLA